MQFRQSQANKHNTRKISQLKSKSAELEQNFPALVSWGSTEEGLMSHTTLCNPASLTPPLSTAASKPRPFRSVQILLSSLFSLKLNTQPSPVILCWLHPPPHPVLSHQANPCPPCHPLVPLRWPGFASPSFCSAPFHHTTISRRPRTTSKGSEEG